LTRGFDDELIREIESRIDIVDIIGERVELTRKGNRYWGLCPFHSEKTPSFSVSQERQLYYCFGCHQGGNIFSFLKNNDKLEFREAIQYLAQKAGLDISRYQTASSSAKSRQDSAIVEINQEAARFYHELLKSQAGKDAVKYLDGRHISRDSIERFNLGYAPDDWRQLEEHLLARGFSIENITESGLVKRSRNANLYMDFLRNRIVFPIYDQGGRVIGFGGRLLSGDGPKYLNSQENSVFSKRSNLFGLFQGRDAIRNSSEVILVEGYLDCISLHQHGIPNTVATLGTALTRQQAKLMKRSTETVILMYDGDEAGQRETLRALAILREENLDSMVVPLPPGNDPDDLVRKQGKEEFLNFIQNNKCTVAEYKLDKYISSGLASDLDERIEILWNVFPEVDRIKSVIAREQQTKNLAYRLNLPEGEVKKEFQLWKKGNGLTGSIRNRNRGLRNNRKREEKRENSVFEEKMLAKMMAEPELFLRIKAELGLDFFSDPAISGLAAIFDEVGFADDSHKTRSLIEEAIFEDEGMLSVWARISILEEEKPLTAFEIEDYIRHQLAKQQRLQWQQFASEIKALESDGDFFSVLKTIVRLGNLTCKAR